MKDLKEIKATEALPPSRTSGLLISLAEEIALLREAGRSWRNIARLLNEVGVDIGKTTLTQRGPDILEKRKASESQGPRTPGACGPEQKTGPVGKPVTPDSANAPGGKRSIGTVPNKRWYGDL
ncbi:MAG: hypothetical protein M1297_07775 [Nitrospirae bacterium]|nr:hypothetical protein [Nitrospirota bacterium]